jgi:hypothetical protein
MDEKSGQIVQDRSVKKRKNTFDGILAEPINPPNLLAVALIADGAPNGAAAVWAEYDKIISEQMHERLQLLATELGVDLLQPDGWALFAWRLAERFVPGLRVDKWPQKKKVGRPRRSRDIALFQAIEVRVSQGATVSDACRSLSKKVDPWKGRKWESLEARYYELKRELKNYRKPKPDPMWDRLEKAAGRMLINSD